LARVRRLWGALALAGAVFMTAVAAAAIATRGQTEVLRFLG